MAIQQGSYHQSEIHNGHSLATTLGWVSVGLGVAEVAIPRRFARLIGVNGNHNRLMRLMGIREIASGVGILTGTRREGWMWSRVGGDVIDLALLGRAFKSDETSKTRASVTTAAVAGITALDWICKQKLGNNGTNYRKHFSRSITINRTPQDVYEFWRNFSNLPRFMSHLKSVTVGSEGRSRWRAKAPAGTTVEWDAEITSDKPGEFISWVSRGSSDIQNSGSVSFQRAPGGRGTLLKVDIQYRPPGGAIGTAIAKLFGEAPEKQVPVDLHRLKQFLETGEIATTEGQSAGRPRSTSILYDDFVRN